MRLPRRCRWISTNYLLLLTAIVLILMLAVSRRSLSPVDDNNILNDVSEHTRYFDRNRSIKSVKAFFAARNSEVTGERSAPELKSNITSIDLDEEHVTRKLNQPGSRTSSNTNKIVGTDFNDTMELLRKSKTKGVSLILENENNASEDLVITFNTSDPSILEDLSIKVMNNGLRLETMKSELNIIKMKSDLKTIRLKRNHSSSGMTNDVYIKGTKSTPSIRETKSDQHMAEMMSDLSSRAVKNKLGIKVVKSDPISRAIGSDLASRAMDVSKQCDRLSQFGPTNSGMHHIMTNPNTSLAYCYIPKCGCTFWKRVIRFLNKDFHDKNITSPFQIRRTETHSWMYSNPNTYIPFNIFSKIGTMYKRFMFVREPYSRLWSAYVDKFYLPDFWYDFHTKINENRTPASASPCVNDVTFHEFVSLSLVTQEPHWDPMYQVCDPCRYKPSFIGHIESFGSDSKVILESANLSWILDGYDHESHVQEEIITLINYNFELFAIKPYIIRCISTSGMFNRLWKSFQINGYLPVSAAIPDLDSIATVEHFKRIVINEYRKRPNTPDVWRKQRKEFMVDAYKTIPSDRMRDLRMKYARDFLLFNYNPKPAELFSYRH